MTERSLEGARDMHVVILNNYIRKHHVDVYRELAKRVGKITILLSTEMEPDRDWEPEWADLDVRVQKNWMFRARWNHSTGFNEPNFIHVPVDTSSQLKSLQPDIVFSYEMGMRTFFCTWFRRFHPNVPLVLVGNMSEHVERERGFLRRMLRKYLRRKVDGFSFNGPSCRRYLESLGIEEKKLFHLPYSFDLDKAYHGHKTYSSDGIKRISYTGALSLRKGVLRFTKCLRDWSDQHPEQKIEFTICGTGEQREEIHSLGSDSLKLNFLGQCDQDQLCSVYEKSDLFVFPTLADEWGLAPVEALASGVPVIGSAYAQSVETLLKDDSNGWSYLPDDEASAIRAIGQAMLKTPTQLSEMGVTARKTVEHITPERSADCFCKIIDAFQQPSCQELKNSPVQLTEPAL